MAEKMTSAPPLTVDNVLTAIQGVQWLALLEAFSLVVYVDFCHVTLLQEIKQQCQSNDDRLHAVVKTWLQGDRCLGERSWRHLIWSLDHGNRTGIHMSAIADKIRHFSEPVGK